MNSNPKIRIVTKTHSNILKSPPPPLNIIFFIFFLLGFWRNIFLESFWRWVTTSFNSCVSICYPNRGYTSFLNGFCWNNDGKWYFVNINSFGIRLVSGFWCCWWVETRPRANALGLCSCWINFGFLMTIWSLILICGCLDYHFGFWITLDRWNLHSCWSILRPTNPMGRFGFGSSSLELAETLEDSGGTYDFCGIILTRVWLGKSTRMCVMLFGYRLYLSDYYVVLLLLFHWYWAWIGSIWICNIDFGVVLMKW